MRRAAPARLRDPGAQAERTLLAWTRTCLALVAVTLVVLRVAAGAGWSLLGAAAVLGTAAGLSVGARRCYLGVTAGSHQPADGLALVLTVGALTVCVLCGASVVA